ncbi:MAG: hypothetical protein H5T69_06310 [Chloroflexi bacterium]|nr:hypothetical protein [Chloroflexota bacterium]
MGDWFRQFMTMPDRQRAKLLLQILAVFFVAVLYGLGGLSLYLRMRYLRPTPTPVRPTVIEELEPPAEETMPLIVVQPTASPTVPPSPTPTRTLYPTITPASVWWFEGSGTEARNEAV